MVIMIAVVFFLPSVCQCKIMRYHARDARSSFEQTGTHLLPAELDCTVQMDLTCYFFSYDLYAENVSFF